MPCCASASVFDSKAVFHNDPAYVCVCICMCVCALSNTYHCAHVLHTSHELHLPRKYACCGETHKKISTHATLSSAAHEPYSPPSNMYLWWGDTTNHRFVGSGEHIRHLLHMGNIEGGEWRDPMFLGNNGVATFRSQRFRRISEGCCSTIVMPPFEWDFPVYNTHKVRVAFLSFMCFCARISEKVRALFLFYVTSKEVFYVLLCALKVH